MSTGKLLFNGEQIAEVESWSISEENNIENNIKNHFYMIMQELKEFYRKHNILCKVFKPTLERRGNLYLLKIQIRNEYDKITTIREYNFNLNGDIIEPVILNGVTK